MTLWSVLLANGQFFDVQAACEVDALTIARVVMDHTEPVDAVPA